MALAQRYWRPLRQHIGEVSFPVIFHRYKGTVGYFLVTSHSDLE